MLNSVVAGGMARGVGYAPNVERSESGPGVPAADVAAVRQMVNELSHTARSLSDRLKTLHDRAGSGTFKNDLNKLIQTLDSYVASQGGGRRPMQKGQLVHRPALRGPDHFSNRMHSDAVSRYDYYTDTSKPGIRPGVGNERGNIWNGFYQGASKGNCVTVASIKAAMMRFGQKPTDIFNHVKAAGDGYNIEMRDGFKLHLSKGELAQAAYRADFKGNDSAMLADAHFLYAASAKRAQLENNKGYAGDSFERALFSINANEPYGFNFNGFLRLGLGAHVQKTNAENLASGQLGLVTHSVPTKDGPVGHSLAVINGREDVWGNRGGYPPTDVHYNALALV